MKNLGYLTVVIVTYQTTEEIILNCLRSIDKNVQVIIVENSENFIHKKLITSEFANVKIICTGENLGYGKGNNFGLKHVRTDYVLILNPDVICDIDFFKNIENVIHEAKDFTIIGCQYLNDKVYMPAGFFNKNRNSKFKKDFQNNMTGLLSKVEWVTGCSMLINLTKFNNKEIFDKNFFLYFEEIDLCKSIIKKGENIFTSQKLRIHHLGFKSSINDNSNNKANLNKIREWHWMWSSFYFYKKNYSYLYALYKMTGKLIKSFLRLFFYFITFQNNKKEKYLYRFLGIFNALIGRSSYFRDNK